MDKLPAGPHHHSRMTKRAARKQKAPVQSPPTTKGRRTRQRLLDAAEVVFGESGYERASIVEITRHADVALGTFYVYFPNKQAIFSELVTELGHGLRRRLAEAIGELSNRIEIEEAGCRAFLEFVRAHRNLYRIVRQAEFVDESLYRSYYQRLASSYVRGLERAVDAGEIRDLDPETVAYALMGIFDFLGMRWVLWNDRLPPRRVVEDVFRLIRHGLGPATLTARDPAADTQREQGSSSTPTRSARRAVAAETAVKKTVKKTATKKAAAKKPAAKKTAAKKPATKKTATKKAAAKKTAAKKAAAKKTATKKTAAQKPAAQKPAAQKPARKPKRSTQHPLERGRGTRASEG